MRNINNIISTVDEKYIKHLAVVLSIFISIWIMSTNDTIALDGVTYADAAHQIQQGNWDEAYAIYRWLFYPALLAFIGKITFLDFEQVGLILNMAFFSMVAWLFISILEDIGATKKVLIAGLIILTVHPSINEYRADLLKGPPFWVCFLLMVRYFLKFQSTHVVRYGVLFSLAAMVSILFRVEGVFFLVFMPLVLLFDTRIGRQQQLVLIWHCYRVPVIVGLVLGISLLVLDVSLPSRAFMAPLRYYDAVFVNIPQLGELLMANVLTPKAEDYGTLGIYAVFLTILIMSIIARTSLVVFALGVCTFLSSRVNINKNTKRVLLSFVVINCFFLFLHILIKYFISGRYAMPSMFVIMLMASFTLAYLFELKKSPVVLVFKTITYTWLFLLLVDGLVSIGPSKHYIKDAGLWLRENIEDDETLLSSHDLVRYYAGVRENKEQRNTSRIFNSRLSKGKLPVNDILQADYIAVRDKYVDKSTINKLDAIVGRKPVRIFTSDKGVNVLIYYQGED